jgi:dissimilatory sulfite reductase (desulfoviridin) alpha/beta subunit
MVQYIKYKTTQIGDKIIDLHWEEIYNCQTLHVAIVDSIMKEEDAQRMGKTVDRVGLFSNLSLFPDNFLRLVK